MHVYRPGEWQYPELHGNYEINVTFSYLLATCNWAYNYIMHNSHPIIMM